MKKWFILLLFLILMVPACSKAKKPKIGVSVATMQEAVYSFMKQAMMDYKDSDGVDIIWVSAENSEAKQESDVKGLIAQGIDVLILHVVNTATSEGLVTEALEAGIPVIAMDRLPTSARVQLYVTADSRKVGQIQAEYLAEQLQGKGNIIILEGEAGNSVAKLITEGNMDVLKKFPNINIVVRQPHKNWARDLAILTTEDALTKYNNDIQGILANNSSMAMGALDVLLDENLTNQIVTVGADADLDACKAVRAGYLWADIDKMPYEIGLASYRAALRLIKKESIISDTKIDNAGVEVDVKLTSVNLVTKDTVAQEMKYRWGKL